MCTLSPVSVRSVSPDTQPVNNNPTDDLALLRQPFDSSLTDIEISGLNEKKNAALDRILARHTQSNPADLSFTILKGMDLRDKNVNGVILDRADLSGTHVDNLDFDNISMKGAVLNGVKLSWRQAMHADNAGANMKGYRLVWRNPLTIPAGNRPAFRLYPSQPPFPTGLQLLKTLVYVDCDILRQRIYADKRQALQQELALFIKNNIEEGNLSRIDLQHIHIPDTDIQGVDFSGSSLLETNMENCKFTGVNLSYCNMRTVHCGEQTRFDKSEFNYCLINQSAGSPNFDYARFNHTYFINVDFNFSKFNHSKFNKVRIINGAFALSSITNASVVDSVISDTTFKHSSIRSTLFALSDLINVSFKKTTLTGTKFYRCNLKNTNFTGATLDKVKFFRCNLEGAKFDKKWQNSPIFNGAINVDKIEWVESEQQ